MARNIPLTNLADQPDSSAPAGKPKKARKPFFTKSFLSDARLLRVLAIFLLAFSLFTLLSCISYIFTWQDDFSIVSDFWAGNIREDGSETQNSGGLLGALLSNLLVREGLGIAAIFYTPWMFLVALKLILSEPKQGSWAKVHPSFSFLDRTTDYLIETSIWGICWAVATGYIIFLSGTEALLGFIPGSIGYEVARFLHEMISYGTILLLAGIIGGYGVFRYKWLSNVQLVPTDEKIATPKVYRPVTEEPTMAEVQPETEEFEEEILDEKETESIVQATTASPLAMPLTIVRPEPEPEFIPESAQPIQLEIAEFIEEKPASVQENYDPTLDLSRYKYPHLDLLTVYPNAGIQVSEEELSQNQQGIIDTLLEFGIGIKSIKATVGPTVTLYEIVPAEGVRIAKIRNLENDIALKLKALGIRIIAPIPGMGTIGIEVPNMRRETVSMRSVLGTEKFMKSDAELPIILGKSITNELILADLASMPHLLVAGATGQGKSVCLNVILTSLIFKKHPSQLKFVLVDPKKVELNIYHTLERHFLAKLPDTEDAIITDTKKVIHTLNSLCIEMDIRYNLLKDASCRNIGEYNRKFIERRLNPDLGHRFLPYIVVVIDELADLMITAGKEVETPIARIAQLARAIGIHMILATQRPSVNVITGTIKNNFPARISFKVTGLMDSRTILDTVGAEQLIGRGDLLFSSQSNIVRLQCPFIDTPEVEAVCGWVGNQQGYRDAYLLPEFEDEKQEKGDKDFDPKDVDSNFAEAARIVVRTKQGSVTLIQRKLKLGFGRAARIIDQMEANGIVGPAQGSKPREVYIETEAELERILSSIGIS